MIRCTLYVSLWGMLIFHRAVRNVWVYAGMWLFHMNIWKIRWYVFEGLLLKYIHVRPVSKFAYDVWWIMDKVLIINFWSTMMSAQQFWLSSSDQYISKPLIARETIKNKSNHMLNSVVSSVLTFSLALLRTSYIYIKQIFLMSWKYPVRGMFCYLNYF